MGAAPGAAEVPAGSGGPRAGSGPAARLEGALGTGIPEPTAAARPVRGSAALSALCRSAVCGRFAGFDAVFVSLQA